MGPLGTWVIGNILLSVQGVRGHSWGKCLGSEGLLRARAAWEPWVPVRGGLSGIQGCGIREGV